MAKIIFKVNDFGKNKTFHRQLLRTISKRFN